MRQVLDPETWTPECASRHFGLWLIEPHWFQQATAAVERGVYVPGCFRMHVDVGLRAQTARDGDGIVLYVVDNEGIAHIGIFGPMMKADSKFGGTNSVRARRAVRMAADDKEVRGILLRIDSPGGTVAGTQELGDDVRAANEAKPIFTQIEDLGASAAYWIAAQTEQIAANASAEVGSIGTVAIAEDSSKAAEEAGITVHVISTGDFKGAFAEGTEILPEHLAYLQERVDAANAFFLKAVSQGRKLPMSDVRKAADGRVFVAAKAQEIGLIDRIQPIEKTLGQLGKAARGRARLSTRAASARIRGVRLDTLTGSG